MTDAIVVEHLTKRFRIPLDKSSTLKHRVTHLRSAGRYRDLLAVNDVSFTVPEGQFIGITGHNGSGKSTLLKLLARIYQPTSGKVALHSRVSPFLELGVGFNPELTARENIFVNGAILGLDRATLEDRVDGIIDFAELKDFANQKLKNFSSGMQVRLAFSVAIQAEAGILLMDEVLAVGDQTFQERCLEVFARYKREGKTVVLVTHSLGAIEENCDRALLMHHGRIELDGSPSEVAAHYRRMVGEGLSLGLEPPPEKAAPAPIVVSSTDHAESSDARWGSREVTITSVTLRDDAGQITEGVDTGSGVTVEIGFHVDTVVDGLTFGFGLHKADGTHITGSNTHIDHVVVPCPAAGVSSSVTYHIPKIPLKGGTYLISASIYDPPATHAYDHIHQGFPLKIIETHGVHGLLDLYGHWSTEQVPGAHTGATPPLTLPLGSAVPSPAGPLLPEALDTHQG